MITVTKQHSYKSHKYASNHLKIDDNEFIVSGTECFVTDLDDYTILSDFDITEYVESAPSLRSSEKRRKHDRAYVGERLHRCIPRDIRSRKKDKWINVAHLPNFSRAVITRDRLRDRVCTGQILAYHYKECSIEGNRCVYYGFVPTLNFKSLRHLDNDEEKDDNIDNDDGVDDALFATKSFYGAHVISKINVQHVWPRKLYVQLKRDSACSCSDKCVRVSVLTLSDVYATTDTKKILRPKTTYCLKTIPWTDVYVIMGNVNKNVVEGHKEHRMCKTCAQCRKCLNSSVFCREHKRCKHEKTAVDVSSFNLALGIPKIKKCRKITQ